MLMRYLDRRLASELPFLGFFPQKVFKLWFTEYDVCVHLHKQIKQFGQFGRPSLKRDVPKSPGEGFLSSRPSVLTQDQMGFPHLHPHPSQTQPSPPCLACRESGVWVHRRLGITASVQVPTVSHMEKHLLGPYHGRHSGTPSGEADTQPDNTPQLFVQSLKLNISSRCWRSANI